MRLMLDTVSMDGDRRDRRGREGRGADALQRRAASATARRRRWTSRSTRSRAPSCAPRACPTRSPRSRCRSAGTMFDPGPCVYMEKMATSRDLAHLLDLDRPLGETLQLIAKEKGTDVGDVVVIMLDRPRHEDAMRGDPRGRRAHPLHPARRRVGRAARRSPRARRSTCSGASAARPRACCRPRRSSASAARSSAGSGRATTRSAGRARRRLRPRRGARHGPAWCPARTSSSPPPASPTATCSRACTSTAGGRHTESLVHALALGHRAPRHGPPRPREAARDHRRALG